MSFLLESAPRTKSSLKRSIRGALTEYIPHIFRAFIKNESTDKNEYYMVQKHGIIRE